MPYPLRLFFLCLPAVLLFFASKTPVAHGLARRMDREGLPAVDFSCGVHRAHRFFAELVTRSAPER